MKTEFRESFLKDIRKIKDHAVKARILEAIESVESASSLESITNVKKLKTNSCYYRIRVGDHRIGVVLDGKTAVFVRVLHRKEIYRYFPKP